MQSILLFKHFGWGARLLLKHFGCKGRLVFKHFGVKARLLFKHLGAKSDFCSNILDGMQRFCLNILLAKQGFNYFMTVVLQQKWVNPPFTILYIIQYHHGLLGASPCFTSLNTGRECWEHFFKKNWAQCKPFVQTFWVQRN